MPSHLRWCLTAIGASLIVLLLLAGGCHTRSATDSSQASDSGDDGDTGTASGHQDASNGHIPSSDGGLCAPVCQGQSCGMADGCGGTCQQGSGCQCTASCEGKRCSVDDGCGRTCAPGSGCQICAPNSVRDNCRICNAAGSEWVDSNARCALDQRCLNGECVPLKVIVGPEETVFDWSREHCANKKIIVDTPAIAFKDDAGNTQLISSSNNNFRFVGTSLDSVNIDCRITIPSEYSDPPADFNDWEWMTATYTMDGTNVYALLTVEYHGWTRPGQCLSGKSEDCAYGSVTAAISRDGGRTYAHPSRPGSHAAVMPLTQYKNNFAGGGGYYCASNIIQGNDGYYYSLFGAAPYNEYGFNADGSLNTNSVYPHHSQRKGLCLMRTDRIRELDGSGKTEWKLWDGTSFSITSKNPYAEPVDERTQACTPVAGGDSFAFSSISWNVHLGRYLLTMLRLEDDLTTYSTYYSLSNDLISWSTSALMRKGTGLADVYPAILDPEVADRNGYNIQTRNFERSDDQFYLYFVRQQYVIDPNADPMDRDLMRVLITLE
jgi:hypothetical protein